MGVGEDDFEAEPRPAGQIWLGFGGDGVGFSSGSVCYSFESHEIAAVGLVSSAITSGSEGSTYRSLLCIMRTFLPKFFREK